MQMYIKIAKSMMEQTMVVIGCILSKRKEKNIMLSRLRKRKELVIREVLMLIVMRMMPSQQRKEEWETFRIEIRSQSL